MKIRAKLNNYSSIFHSGVGIFFCVWILLGVSCKNATVKEEPSDTPTSGELAVLLDESYQLLFDTEVYSFEALYPNAKVHCLYGTEEKAIEDLLMDSVKVAVLGRPLTMKEKATFKRHDIFPLETKIGTDAIAFVVNQGCMDTLLSETAIEQLLEGKEFGGLKNIVFDHPNSANYHYLKDSLLNGKELGRNCFALNNNPAVFDYVAQHPNSLGVISFNWISDKKDSVSQKLLKKVKVVAVQKKGGDKSYFKPYQAYISTGEYAFTRPIFMVNRQTRNGLGRGFVAFVAGNVGQRIILKMGLLPAIMPSRQVEINVETK